METTMTVASQVGVTKKSTKSPITVSRIYEAEYQKKGTITAELKQSVETVSSYPSTKVETEMQSNLFKAEDFGFEAKVYPSTETRVAWLNVPPASTPESIAKLLAAAPKATIYRVLSNAPILDSDQKYAISQGLRTMDEYANKQVVRYSANDTVNPPNGLILDPNGNVQYRRNFFWNVEHVDQDLRGATNIEPYMSEDIKMELEGAGKTLENQKISF